MDDETGAFVFNDGGPALKDDEVDISQVKGVRGCESDRASSYDYDFEWSAWVAHFGTWSF